MAWSGPLAWAEYTQTPTHDPRRAGFAQRQSTGVATLAGSTLRNLAARAHPARRWQPPLRQPRPPGHPGQLALQPPAINPDQPGSAVQYAFEGRAVAVEIQRGPYWATLKPGSTTSPPLCFRATKLATPTSPLHYSANGVEVVPLARNLTPARTPCVWKPRRAGAHGSCAASSSTTTPGRSPGRCGPSPPC